MSFGKPPKWVLGARSETGYVRTANEDRMGWTRTAYGDVYVVADGMGGYHGGAQAAELTVRSLRDRLAALSPADPDFAEQVRQAFVATNESVFQQRGVDDPETRNMGATGVALIASGARVMVGHVGDSRAYLWRKDNGLKQLTRDHTRVQKMVDAGLITSDQAAVHPDASVLERAIGHQPTVEADVSAWLTLKPGDMVLLCSDGLSGYVPDAEIDKVLRARGDPQGLADKLVDCALDKGGEDNVTVQLVRFGAAAGGTGWDVLGRRAVLLPAAVVLSGAAVWAAGRGQVARLESRIVELQQRLASVQPPQPTVPATPAPAVTLPPPVASAAASPPASAAASAPASTTLAARAASGWSPAATPVAPSPAASQARKAKPEKKSPNSQESAASRAAASASTAAASPASAPSSPAATMSQTAASAGAAADMASASAPRSASAPVAATPASAASTAQQAPGPQGAGPAASSP